MRRQHWTNELRYHLRAMGRTVLGWWCGVQGAAESWWIASERITPPPRRRRGPRPAAAYLLASVTSGGACYRDGRADVYVTADGSDRDRVEAYLGAITQYSRRPYPMNGATW